MFAGHCVQAGQKTFPHFPGMLDQPLFLANAQVMSRANVISKVTAPGRADPARQSETVVFYLVQAWARHDTADLGLFAKNQQVGPHVKMLTTPIPSRDSHTALHFIEDEQEVVLVAETAQGLQKLASKMVVTALALDGLDDDRGDIVRF